MPKTFIARYQWRDPRHTREYSRRLARPKSGEHGAGAYGKRFASNFGSEFWPDLKRKILRQKP